MSRSSPHEETIYKAALEMRSPEGRQAYLEQACGGDQALHARVQALIRVAEEETGFLAVPAIEAAAADALFDERPGAVIGPYKLLEQIGEGGFGVVFVAEQTTPVRRKVALKVLKAGMDTRQVVARFEAERQALAIMDHPNIARVFDGGATASGRPYFVMELVKGVSITEYCDQNRLPPSERLKLFLSVCHAVQHAHQKGIIHRDLKPSNILVSRHDTTPVVKVIDFGVAKALGQELTDKTLFTGFAQMIGTPLYMSPEQAGMSDLDVDTRSDIYSLGVLLYELLTGTTPFTKERFKTAAYDEIRRIIREEEPPKPSFRLSQSTETLPSVAANRGLEPRKLSGVVRGDLDWVVMTALEKDRNRRYETASGLAADVQRYLDDEPVLARSPSVWYRLRKFVHRNRGFVLTASLIFLALLGGVIGTTWGMFRADAARALAANEANEKRRALEEKGVALEDAKDKLFQALVNRARAELNSGRIGQRFATLKTIQEAAKLRITSELKAEAAAALVLPDAEIAYEWDAYPDDAFSLDFDAAFERYARLDRQGRITVCRRTNGGEEILNRLPAQGRPPHGSPMMSPDGRYVAFRDFPDPGKSHLGNTFVWSTMDNPPTASPLVLPYGPHRDAIAYSPNCRQLAIGHVDGWIGVYDLESGKQVKRLEMGSPPTHLAFHPTDGRIAVATTHAVRLFDIETGKESPAFRRGADFECVCWHPDGRRLATSTSDFKIHIWDTLSEREVTSISGESGRGNRVAFNPAGTLLACRSWHYPSRIRDAKTGRLLIEGPSLGNRFSKDGRLFGFGVEGRKVRLWRVADGRELRVLRDPSSDDAEAVRKTILHQDGRLLAAWARNWLGIFDVVSGEELASVRLPRIDTAFPVTFDPPSGLSNGKPDWKSNLSVDEKAGGLVTGGLGGMHYWPARLVPGPMPILRIGPARFLMDDATNGGYSSGASTSPDGRIMAVPQGGSTLLVHRDQPNRRIVLDRQFDVRFTAVSPDGRWVFTGSHWTDGRSSGARIWDAETGKFIHELELDGSTPARFSLDGKWLLANSASGARLFEVGNWREVRRLKGYGAFSPDSRLLALRDGDRGMLIEETATGREIARITRPKLFGYSPDVFTPDGTRLIAFDEVWDLGLIRIQLKELGLDWDWPEFPPPAPGSDSSRPLQVDLIEGDLGIPQASQLQGKRKAIEACRRLIAANPNDAVASNKLAWHYLTGPETLRDVKAALPLAEKAMQSDRGNSMFANTLGVAYYRNGRYRNAVDTLRANLSRAEDRLLAHDLYFLAMSHHELGDAERARDFLALANRSSQAGLNPVQIEEINAFRSEAEKVLGGKSRNSVEASPPPSTKK